MTGGGAYEPPLLTCIQGGNSRERHNDMLPHRQAPAAGARKNLGGGQKVPLFHGRVYPSRPPSPQSAESLGKERRGHARRTISEPALLRDAGGLAYPGMACDVSAGGICVSAPADFPAEVGSEICVVFALPDIESPLTVKCAPSHMRPQAGRVRLGASFIDDGSPAYATIRRCMMD